MVRSRRAAFGAGRLGLVQSDVLQEDGRRASFNLI
jgi:hypothetical protein